ncbi:hypothetical protein F750_1986 [Streptomyces sp. PAMC 26508]|nr:hypothetical protein F750_1986 [Streptomyces sp. PAMC 26508]
MRMTLTCASAAFPARSGRYPSRMPPRVAAARTVTALVGVGPVAYGEVILCTPPAPPSAS